MDIRIKIINEKIEEKERMFIDEPIRVNCEDLLKEISGLEKPNKYYLILIGKVFSSRGWKSRRTNHLGRKRYYEYIPSLSNESKLDSLWK